MEFEPGMAVVLEPSLSLWLGMVEEQSMALNVLLDMEHFWLLELVLGGELGVVQELRRVLALHMEQGVALELPQDSLLELVPDAIFQRFVK